MGGFITPPWELAPVFGGNAGFAGATCGGASAPTAGKATPISNNAAAITIFTDSPHERRPIQTPVPRNP